GTPPRRVYDEREMEPPQEPRSHRFGGGQREGGLGCEVEVRAGGRLEGHVHSVGRHEETLPIRPRSSRPREGVLQRELGYDRPITAPPQLAHGSIEPYSFRHRRVEFETNRPPVSSLQAG